MKHSYNKCLLLLAMLSWTVFGFADPVLDTLRIKVVLENNGDAHIIETRYMNIDDVGTECYIVIGNLRGREIHNFNVTDENGLSYTNVGEWDISANRKEKTNKCGIVTKENGFELCWGLGKEGERTYVASYTLTNLVKAYPDADGFNFMFVAEDLKPAPQSVVLTIESADTLKFSHDNSGIWGFRYIGDVNFSDEGTIVAKTSEPFKEGSAMIIMCQFDKGLFSPTVEGNGTFEAIRNRAFENSSYQSKDDDDDISLPAAIMTTLLMGLGFSAPFLPNIMRRRSLRKKVNKNLLYYRDVPMNGDLHEACKALNALKSGSDSFNNLLSASILQLIELGAISIQQEYSEGKIKNYFAIHEIPNKPNLSELLLKLHTLLNNAAGKDHILQPKELRNYMENRHHFKEAEEFVECLRKRYPLSHWKKHIKDLRELFGMKKFLEDFSLLNERHVQEITLWKHYMIWATLFGIADKVIKDMKKINPEYFNMDAVAHQMVDDSSLPLMYMALQEASHSTYSRITEVYSGGGSDGGGGSSSWGGGGGYSGGGSGGGVR